MSNVEVSFIGSDQMVGKLDGRVKLKRAQPFLLLLFIFIITLCSYWDCSQSNNITTDWAGVAHWQ
jgi:hypothetical protein